MFDKFLFQLAILNLSNITIIKQNPRVNYVWLILISTVFVEHNINQTKSGQQLGLINSIFDLIKCSPKSSQTKSKWIVKIKIVEHLNDDFNTELSTLTLIFVGNDTYVPVHDITVKQLQTLFKTALGRTSTTEFERKLGISNFDPDCILKVRKQISNVKLRNIFYRLIINNFLTKSKMLKFKMTDSAECERCGAEETTKRMGLSFLTSTLEKF